MKHQWLDVYVSQLRSAQKRSAEEDLLIALYDDREHLTAIQKKKLEALVSAFKAIQKANKAKADLRALEASENALARKERNHQLFLSGGLLIAAGLVDSKTGKPFDQAALIGGLFALAEQMKDPNKKEVWSQKGNHFLAKAEAERKEKAQAKAEAKEARSKRIEAAENKFQVNNETKHEPQQHEHARTSWAKEGDY